MIQTIPTLIDNKKFIKEIVEGKVDTFKLNLKATLKGYNELYNQYIKNKYKEYTLKEILDIIQSNLT